MHFFNIFKKKRLIVLIIIIVFAFIVTTLGIIYYVDNFSPNKSVGNNLTGYGKFLKKVNSLSTEDPQLASNANYQKFISSLNRMGSNKLTKEQQYNEWQFVQKYLVFAYADTNNHELYILQEQLKDLIINNFPEKNLTKKKPSCFDPSCADSPQPKEILAVIEEIKNSKIPENLKQSNIADLTNFGYLNKENDDAKALDYLILAEDIKNNDAYTKAGINVKIYQEITGYVKIAFPKQYDEYIKLQNYNDK